MSKRGKPIAAIVSAEDLQRLESNDSVRARGLLALQGALAEFEDYAEIMEDVVRSRQFTMDREVSLD